MVLSISNTGLARGHLLVTLLLSTLATPSRMLRGGLEGLGGLALELSGLGLRKFV